jgi:hypothetical protein
MLVSLAIIHGMAECEWAILCEYPFRDAQRRLGMIGIFDVVAFDELPQVLRHGWLNLKFRGRPGEQVDFAVRIFPPGAEVIDTPEPPAVTIGDGGSIEMSLDLQDLTLERFGVYEFEILVHAQPALVTSLKVIRR